MTPTPARCLLGKPQPGWFGLMMHARVRQRRRRQVMVGDEHAHAEAVRFGDAFDARDAVVHRDQDVRARPGVGEPHDLGREPVAVLEAVRHEVLDVGAERAQRAHPTAQAVAPSAS